MFASSSFSPNPSSGSLVGSGGWGRGGFSCQIKNYNRAIPLGNLGDWLATGSWEFHKCASPFIFNSCSNTDFLISPPPPPPPRTFAPVLIP